ncbi:MAG: hypothetical protein HY860_04415 [Chlamydiales bacterium]|nr:hypothetical protein [Chlamydiales bacterium]
MEQQQLAEECGIIESKDDVEFIDDADAIRDTQKKLKEFHALHGIIGNPTKQLDVDIEAFQGMRMFGRTIDLDEEYVMTRNMDPSKATISLAPYVDGTNPISELEDIGSKRAPASITFRQAVTYVVKYINEQIISQEEYQRSPEGIRRVELDWYNPIIQRFCSIDYLDKIQIVNGKLQSPLKKPAQSTVDILFANLQRVGSSSFGVSVAEKSIGLIDVILVLLKHKGYVFSVNCSSGDCSVQA